MESSRPPSQEAPSGIDLLSVCLRVRRGGHRGDKLFCHVSRQQALSLRRAYSHHPDIASAAGCRVLAFQCIALSLRTLGLVVSFAWKDTRDVEPVVGLLQAASDPPEMSVVVIPFEYVKAATADAAEKLKQMKEEGIRLYIHELLVSKTPFMEVYDTVAANMAGIAVQLAAQQESISKRLLELSGAVDGMETLSSLCRDCLDDGKRTQDALRDASQGFLLPPAHVIATLATQRLSVAGSHMVVVPPASYTNVPSHLPPYGARHAPVVPGLPPFYATGPAPPHLFHGPAVTGPVSASASGPFSDLCKVPTWVQVLGTVGVETPTDRLIEVLQKNLPATLSDPVLPSSPLFYSRPPHSTGLSQNAAQESTSAQRSTAAFAVGSPPRNLSGHHFQPASIPTSASAGSHASSGAHTAPPPRAQPSVAPLARSVQSHTEPSVILPRPTVSTVRTIPTSGPCPSAVARAGSEKSSLHVGTPVAPCSSSKLRTKAPTAIIVRSPPLRSLRPQIKLSASCPGANLASLSALPTQSLPRAVAGRGSAGEVTSSSTTTVARISAALSPTGTAAAVPSWPAGVHSLVSRPLAVTAASATARWAKSNSSNSSPTVARKKLPLVFVEYAPPTSRGQTGLSADAVGDRCHSSQERPVRRSPSPAAEKLCAPIQVRAIIDETSVSVTRPPAGAAAVAAESPSGAVERRRTSADGIGSPQAARSPVVELRPQFAANTAALAESRLFKSNLSKGESVWVFGPDEWFVKGRIKHITTDANGQEDVCVTCRPVSMIGGSGGSVLRGNNLTIAKVQEGPIDIEPGMAVVGPYDQIGHMYSGVIAELPCLYNKQRCLVFFDDGLAHYIPRTSLHPLVRRQGRSEQVSEAHDLFLRSYFSDLIRGQRVLVEFSQDEVFSTEWKSHDLPTRVAAVDGSLVKVVYLRTASGDAAGKTLPFDEWIYRGNPRLSPVNAALKYLEDKPAVRKDPSVKFRVSVAGVRYNATFSGATAPRSLGDQSLDSDWHKDTQKSKTKKLKKKKKKRKNPSLDKSNEEVFVGQKKKGKYVKDRMLNAVELSKKEKKEKKREEKKKKKKAVQLGNEVGQYDPVRAAMPLLVRQGNALGPHTAKQTGRPVSTSISSSSKSHSLRTPANFKPRSDTGAAQDKRRPQLAKPRPSGSLDQNTTPAFSVRPAPGDSARSLAEESGEELDHCSQRRSGHRVVFASSESEATGYGWSDPGDMLLEDAVDDVLVVRGDVVSTASGVGGLELPHAKHSSVATGSSPPSAFSQVGSRRLASTSQASTASASSSPSSGSLDTRPSSGSLDARSLTASSKDTAAKVLERWQSNNMLRRNSTPAASPISSRRSSKNCSVTSEETQARFTSLVEKAMADTFSEVEPAGVVCPVRTISADQSRLPSADSSPPSLGSCDSPASIQPAFHVQETMPNHLSPSLADIGAMDSVTERHDEELTQATEYQVAKAGNRGDRSPGFSAHICSWSCNASQKANKDLWFKSGMFSRPLLLGWQRMCQLYVNDEYELPIICYLAPPPCRRRLRNLEEVQHYLQLTGTSNVTIDQFSFELGTRLRSSENWLKKFTLVSTDISNSLEAMPLACFARDAAERLPKEFRYSPTVSYQTVRPAEDDDFLVCCDCTDGCLDKEKCACQQLSKEAAQINRNKDSYGYTSRRKTSHSLSAIYECNSRCKCLPTCANRVVQHGIQVRLAVIHTGTEKGWGLFTLDDIPCGTFVCTYVGLLLTSEEGDETGKKFGDEYFADLDHIENCEREKAGFEAAAPSLNQLTLSGTSGSLASDDFLNRLTSSGSEKMPTTPAAAAAAAPAVPVATPDSSVAPAARKPDGDAQLVACQVSGHASTQYSNDLSVPSSPAAAADSNGPSPQVLSPASLPSSSSTPSPARQNLAVHRRPKLIRPWCDKDASKGSGSVVPAGKRPCLQSPPETPYRARRTTARASTGGWLAGWSSDPIVISDGEDNSGPQAESSLEGPPYHSRPLSARSSSRVDGSGSPPPLAAAAEAGIGTANALSTADADCMALPCEDSKGSLDAVKAAVSGVAVSGVTAPHSSTASFLSQASDDDDVSTLRKLYGDQLPIVLDAKCTGNVGRFINNSCDANLFVQNVFHSTHDLRFPTVAFFAQRSIKAESELTWAYGYEPGSVEGKTIRCCCGSSHCRGRLL